MKLKRKAALIVASFFLSLVFVFFSYNLSFAASSYDMSDSSSWNLRVDGQYYHDHIPDKALRVADLDNDGINDYIFGSIGSDYNGSHTGSLFFINGTLLGSSTIGQTYDLQGSTTFSLRLDHTTVDSYYPYTLETADLNNDGLKDIIVAVPYDTSGGAYIIFNDLLTNYTGVGNTRNITDSSTYSIKYSGFGVQSVTVGDFDGDHLFDIAIGAVTSYQAAYAGSVFVIFNHKFSGVANGTTLSLTDSANYDLRIDGSIANSGLGRPFLRGLGDINDDGKDELGASSYGHENGNGNYSGSLYLFSGDFLTSYKSSGSAIAVGDSSSYNIRVDGSVVPDFLATQGFSSGDIDADGKKDVIIGASGVNSWTGAVYLMCGSFLTSKLSTFGNILETSQTDTYNVKFNGVNVDDDFGDYFVESADMNNDGYDDMVLGADMDDKNGAGELYVIYGKSTYCSSLGSSLNMSDTANYNVKYLGVSNSWLSGIPGGSLQDVNLDGSYDILVGALMAGYNSRGESGSFYTILNYPHTITATNIPSSVSSNSFTVNGTVSAPNSVTNISGVQYSIDNSSPTASTWTACSADDGSFNSKEEDFTCSVRDQTLGSHTIYIRAYDTNASYTVQSRYYTGNYSVMLGVSSSSSSPPAPQIPQLSQPKWSGVVKAIDESPSTDCRNQQVITIIEPKTFSFDAYLSSQVAVPSFSSGILPNPLSEALPSASSLLKNIIVAGNLSSRIILGIKMGDGVFWQLGCIQQIWYKAYAPGYLTENAAKIIPELQKKPSIIALSYTDQDLIPPGQPNKPFKPSSLKLAYSIDGIKWKILSSSVVDTKNKTVAALDKVGGYYMIVGRY